MSLKILIFISFYFCLSLQHDFYMNVFGYGYAHKLSQCSFICLQVYQSLVYTHFPMVPCRRTFTIRAFSTGHDKFLRRKRDGSRHSDSRCICYLLHLLAYSIQLLMVRARQLYPRFLVHFPFPFSSAYPYPTSALHLLPYPQQPSAPCHGLQTFLTVVSLSHAR